MSKRSFSFASGLVVLLLVSTLFLYQNLSDSKIQTSSRNETNAIEQKVSHDVASDFHFYENDHESKGIDSSENERLYDNNVPATESYSRLVELAEKGDGRSALRLVDIESRCSLFATKSKYLAASQDAIAKNLIADTDGRSFFGLSLAFPGSNISDYEDLTSYISSNEKLCTGFDERFDGADKYKYLQTAANSGIAEAQIALWGMPDPDVSAAIAASFKSGLGGVVPAEILSAKRQWELRRIDHLAQAAAGGDPRAWVLLADLFSGVSAVNVSVPLDPVSAYAYYYCASTKIDFPFIRSRLELTKNQLDRQQMMAAERLIGTILKKS